MRTSNDRKDNERIFVYKIIHDLRAPTDSVAMGIKEMAKELAMEHLKYDSSLVMESRKKFKYTG